MSMCFVAGPAILTLGRVLNKVLADNRRLGKVSIVHLHHPRSGLAVQLLNFFNNFIMFTKSLKSNFLSSYEKGYPYCNEENISNICSFNNSLSVEGKRLSLQYNF